MFPHSFDRPVFLRSAAKPFQAFPLYQNPQANTITLEEWAIICASHAATPHQLSLVEQVLSRAGATPNDLQCGPHPPIDESVAKQLICQGQTPGPIHNNCSGKHAGMLLACRLYGWPLESYLDPDHPLQQAILQTLIRFSGTSRISVAVDGCGAPVFCLPLQHIAYLYSQLAVHPDLAPLADAMIRYPDIVGDAQRIDSQLMKVSNGSLVAKVGAEGLLGVGNRITGEGLAIKAHDGNNAIRDRVVIAILADLNWLSPEQAEVLWAQPDFSKARLNTQGKTVGCFDITLPWENPLSRHFVELNA